MRAQDDGKANRVSFHFFGEQFRYHPNRLLARLQSWLLYRNWQRESLARAMDLHQKYGFSITHHVTYATWRMPPQLWRMPIPFVFGPVGGAGSTPPAFRSMLGLSARAFELLRDAATTFSSRSRNLTLCCGHSEAVLAADTATADFLAKEGASHVPQLCQVFFSDYQASQFTRPARERKIKATKLKIFAGGNLEGRKGTQLSLRALSLLKAMGVPFSYTYGGWGPELGSMKALAHQLGIAQHVCFHEGYAGIDYAQQLITNDVYLLPSVRETSGITMMEAMIAGCLPIVLGGTGAGDIVERSGGEVIQADSPEEAIRKIAARLEWCWYHPTDMQQQAETAGRNVRNLFSERNYQNVISDIYSDVVKRHCDGSRRT